MDDDNSILPPPKRTPWNKGKLIRAKPPLLARHVWSIRTKQYPVNGLWGAGTGHKAFIRYSIISSADTMIEFGRVNPSVLAVFMLAAISNLVGRSIGKSDGGVPLRTRST